MLRDRQVDFQAWIFVEICPSQFLAKKSFVFGTCRNIESKHGEYGYGLVNSLTIVGRNFYSSMMIIIRRGV